MSAEPRVFLDSNVLVYAVGSDARRTAPAFACVEAGGVISAQVLNEVAHVLRRKRGLDWPALADLMALFAGLLEVVAVTPAAQQAGLRIARATGWSVWDAQIVASADEAGCTVLLSEDMQDGRTVGGVTLRNPFEG